MDLKSLFSDEDAVSPVIGVILMVAITVILAAVIGTFVLGLGDRVSQASPSATFTFDYSENGGNITVDVVHDGGNAVPADQVNVTVGGQNVYGDGELAISNSGDNSSFPSGDITAGDTLTINSSTFSDGDTVKVIWHASGSDKTAVIGESEVNT
ncbi:type IV pilin N-terminal domain-containing protein [Halorussus gelatinilyticus]|uniref:Type IV pilin N-terminal domain-containing protein n=1 Tax=Halorussus gelatinilyticus TaxID=2937524 RepID=A0A8U0IG34_9EURY|nr:type IV pilin N-terminal domain-containing protein [Halorussus gelatinilyticus]UPV99694.1 type IV pilin N-terminal domain-containing protein [Halorussus gelatinilyticus]